MASERKEPLEIRTLRAEHAAADKAAGMLIASQGVGSGEYLQAEKTRSEAWSRLRDALGLSRDFV